MRKLKKLKFGNKYFLAPMEEINDIAFRLLCKKAGCGMTYTGMIHPQTRQNIFLDDKPMLQLFCTTTKGIKEFMKAHDKKVVGWDFNLGCPAKTARKHGFGSFLNDLKTIEKILKVMRENTAKPLTVKFRKSSYAFDLLKIAEKYCDAVCIHPRTQAQGYSGEPDLEFAKKIKKSTFLPVIYSGNATEKNADKLLKIFDFVMIGREAIGRPEVFAKLANKKYKKDFNNYLKLVKKYDLPFRQIKLQAMNFTKGQKGATEKRLKIFEVKSLEELKQIY